MAFNPQKQNNNKKEYPLPPEGTTPARLARIIELGTQDTQYGEMKQIILQYSLPMHQIEYNEEWKQQFISTSRMKMSSFKDTKTNRKSTLMKHVDALGEGCEDIKELLGKECLLTIVHNKSMDGSKVYANIDNISKPMPGMNNDELDTEPFYFDFEYPEDDTWNRLSNYQKDIIRSSIDYPGSEVEVVDLRNQND